MPVRLITLRSSKETGLAGRLLRDAVVLLGLALAIVVLKSVSAGAADHSGPLAPSHRSGTSQGPTVETGRHAAVPPVVPELTDRITDPSGTVGTVVGPVTGRTAAPSAPLPDPLAPLGALPPGAGAGTVSPSVDRIVPPVVAGAAPVAPVLAPVLVTVGDAVAPVLDPVLGTVGPVTGPIVPGPPGLAPGDDRPTPPAPRTPVVVPADDAASDGDASPDLPAATEGGHGSAPVAGPTIAIDPTVPAGGSGSGFGASLDPGRARPSGPMRSSRGLPTDHSSPPRGSPCVRDLPAPHGDVVAVMSGAGDAGDASSTLLVSPAPDVSTASAGTPPFSPD